MDTPACFSQPSRIPSQEGIYWPVNIQLSKRLKDNFVLRICNVLITLPPIEVTVHGQAVTQFLSDSFSLANLVWVFLTKFLNSPIVLTFSNFRWSLSNLYKSQFLCLLSFSKILRKKTGDNDFLWLSNKSWAIFPTHQKSCATIFVGVHWT